jgi:inorganic pyrophosphatase
MVINSLDFIGKTIQIKVDRPLGSLHPTWLFLYPINYGYVPSVQSADGEELDAYILGVFEPVEIFTGQCIAVIQRTDDSDDKLVLTPIGKTYTDDQILALVEFQERFFISTIVRVDNCESI